MERIDKLISSRGTLSRNEVKKLIRAGQVTLNGNLVTSSDEKADPQTDLITLGGKPLTLPEHLYLMLNKPQNVVSSTEAASQKTVIDLVPPALRRPGLFPAGRLDKDTTGFVLITDDGDFAHSILSPRRHVPKTYEVTIDSPLTKTEIEQIEQGLLVGNTTFRPASITLLAKDSQSASYEIILHEGKYHQIKRMFSRFQKTVITLHRTRMGGLSLDPALQPGQCKTLSPNDLEQLRGSRKIETKNGI